MQHSYVRRELKSLNEQKFTRLCQISYGPADDAQERKWEMVQRTTRTIPFESFKQSPAPLPVDAVEICAVLERAGEKHLILVAQYRPPLDAVVLEFPAGLVDAGESPRTAAVRELFEETGYTATEDEVTGVSAPICPEPGLSDTCCKLVRIAVNGSKAENVSPKQHLDDGEDIEVVLLRVDDKSRVIENIDTVVAEKQAKGVRTIVDAKLYTFLYGLTCWSATGKY